MEQLKNEYAGLYTGKTPAGTVSEEFFVTNGATDVLGNVAVKNATATKTPDFSAPSPT